MISMNLTCWLYSLPSWITKRLIVFIDWIVAAGFFCHWSTFKYWSISSPKGTWQEIGGWNEMKGKRKEKQPASKRKANPIHTPIHKRQYIIQHKSKSIIPNTQSVAHKASLFSAQFQQLDLLRPNCFGGRSLVTTSHYWLLRTPKLENSGWHGHMPPHSDLALAMWRWRHKNSQTSTAQVTTKGAQPLCTQWQCEEVAWNDWPIV